MLKNKRLTNHKKVIDDFLMRVKDSRSPTSINAIRSEQKLSRVASSRVNIRSIGSACVRSMLRLWLLQFCHRSPNDRRTEKKNKWKGLLEGFTLMTWPPTWCGQFEIRQAFLNNVCIYLWAHCDVMRMCSALWRNAQSAYNIDTPTTSIIWTFASTQQAYEHSSRWFTI